MGEPTRVPTQGCRNARVWEAKVPGAGRWTQSALSMGKSTQGLMAMTATTSGPSAGHQHSVLCSEFFSECLTVILDDMDYLDLSLFTHFN